MFYAEEFIVRKLSTESSVSHGQIELRNVRVHNLQGIDLNIPHGQWLSICGVSGSGKSSLAFDTLYAEGQRRYIESLSPYTRQFLQQLDKPDADRIDGIPPAIAVRAARNKSGLRSTVGTVTETVEYLRLLFSKIATVHCPDCQCEVVRDHPQSAADSLSDPESRSRLMVGFELHVEAADELFAALMSAKRNGFARAVVAGHTIDLESLAADDCDEQLQATVIVDRLTLGSPLNRIRESFETAFHFGRGRSVALVSADAAPRVEIDGAMWQVRRYNLALVCGNCGHEFPQPSPRLFSFNSPLGACQNCDGFGSVQRFDMDLIVPDRGKSIRDGAIAPWNTPAYAHEREELIELADDYSIPVDVPFAELSDEQVQLIWDGVSERDFGGLSGFFDWLEKRRYKMHLRVFLSRWRAYDPCTMCNGTRLNQTALSFRVGNQNLGQICELAVEDAHQFFQQLEPRGAQRAVSARVLNEIVQRLKYLVDVGLGYLTLNRTLRTLSGGEAQRVSLTSSLSSTLVNMLYVLDEPSVGLHVYDIQKLTGAIKHLNQRGNTLVVVDHQPDIICSAERVIEIGPAAGASGGQIVFDGAVKELLDRDGSATGDFLSGRRGINTGSDNRRTPRGKLELKGARGHNLKNIDVDFPLGCMCVVTGVSGSGKSSLVQQTLYGALCKRKKKSVERPLPYTDVYGDSLIDDVILFDQSPIGRSPRSNPVTYVKVFDEIRKTFAQTMDAKTRNLKPGHFSFNVAGGRCDKCEGDGQLAVDMQFMADIYMTCDQCRGTRYRDEVLEVKYRGKNIAETLDLTVRQGFSFFRGQPKVQAKLKALIDVGLEYIRLGQPANTLSSGEAQRLKLAMYLNVTKKRRSLFILDEPTTGLHMADVLRLVDCLEALLAVGHSLIIVEHNLNLIKYADWIIDLGPGAAGEGGQVMATGPPEAIVENTRSLTGEYLKPILARAIET